jgi:hypothetical protein
MSVSSVHERALWKSSQIAGFQMEKLISPQEVIRVLNKGKISFVLVGAYGLAGWMRVRATEDVDVVVALRQVKKAVALLVAAFPGLEAEDLEVVVRLRDKESGEVAIEVMKPVQQPYREIFKHVHKVSAAGQEYRIPALEMALICKFAPMVSLMRADDRKHQDAADFIVMVRQNPTIDMATLGSLGDLVYPGGGKEVIELVRKVRAGEKLVL